jgi:translation initiation factor 1
MGKNKKSRKGIVYSTDPEFQYRYEETGETTTLPPSQQTLTILMDKKGRGGKTVTLISGFTGSENDLKHLGKTLKTLCGTGGSTKERDILIQGNFREKISDHLQKLGYRVKKKGG